MKSRADVKLSDVVKRAQDASVKFVDLKFVDMLGTWQHFGVPLHQLDDGLVKDGSGFDGSSIRGWQPINASDMVIKPDLSTAKIDPFSDYATMSIVCNVFDPLTGIPYSKDPRFVAQKAEKYLTSLGIADTAYYGAEPEFFIFDDVRFQQTPNVGFYQVDSAEGRWNTARLEEPNLAHKPNYKGGYFPVAPTDSLVDIRREMVEVLESLGITIEAEHHEVATAGQCEIDMRFEPLLNLADTMMWFKYVVKNVAHVNGKTATFMPKPIHCDNGSGMHTHISLWNGKTPLFAGNEYAGLSQMALHFIGGILKHAPAVCAFANPTTNSYRRLVPGYEAPVNLAYSSRNRSAAIRIPMYSDSPKAKRIEFRTPDPACNPYLSFAALLMAGLDGIERKLDPGKALDKDIYSMSESELSSVPKVPTTLTESLNALKKDHDFLLKGDVFTPDLIESWYDLKMNDEIKPALSRPTPTEFEFYYDC